jgi:hypothetical protein
MSDFSGLEQSFALPAVPPQTLPGDLPDDEVPLEVQPHEVGFRRLRGAREIGRILPLRQEIALPASALDDPGFAAREKKETKSGSSALSCVWATT